MLARGPGAVGDELQCQGAPPPHFGQMKNKYLTIQKLNIA